MPTSQRRADAAVVLGAPIPSAAGVGCSRLTPSRSSKSSLLAEAMLGGYSHDETPCLFRQPPLCDNLCSRAPHGVRLRLDFFFFNFYLFIHLFLTVLGLRCYVGFSLVAASGGCSLAAVRGSLAAVASLVEHRLQVHRLQYLWHVAELPCSMWNLPGTGIKCLFPALAGRHFYHWTTREVRGWTSVNHIFAQHLALKGFS